MAIVIGVNISQKKGTIKTPVSEININEYEVVGDAHAGDWNRQVSLLAVERVKKWSKQSVREVNSIEFAGNITTEGILFSEVHPGDRLIIHSLELEITETEKECHGKSCAIFSEVGNCVMLAESVFAKVITTGNIKAGNEIIYLKKPNNDNKN